MTKIEKREELNRIIETAQNELIALDAVTLEDIHAFAVFTDAYGDKKCLIPVYDRTELVFCLSGLHNNIAKPFSDSYRTQEDALKYAKDCNWVYVGTLSLNEEN